jgi:hypothetical protein
MAVTEGGDFLALMEDNNNVLDLGDVLLFLRLRA